MARGALPTDGLGTDAVVRWFAHRQSGVVGIPQLLEAGVTRRAVQGRVERGVLRRIRRGVLQFGAGDLTPEGRLWAALLALPEGAVLSHRSAAALLGLLPHRHGGVHVTVAVGRHLDRPGVVVHRSPSVAAASTVREGLPCTTVERTMIDVAATDGPAAATRCWSTAASRRVLRPGRLEQELRLQRGRPGAPIVRGLLERHRLLLTGRTRSELERAALRMCAKHGLPPPRSNTLVEVDGGVYEADLLWTDAAVIVELDDWSTHGDADAFRRDRVRDFDVQLTGYVTVRLLWPDVTTDAARTAERLGRLLARRGETS